MRTNKVSATDFAEDLYKWYQDEPVGIGTTVFRVVSTPQFTQYPHKAAELAWNLKKQQNAANGAIMRTSILGVWQNNDIKEVVKNTEMIAKTTHFDPRSVGSCVIITSIIATLIHQNKLLDFNEICDIADKYDPRIKPFIIKTQTKDIAELKLDEQKSIGYTLKALSAGLWTYFNANSFEEGILKVIHEGGDADTNACVAGSILGAKFGFDNIPKRLVDGLLYKEDLHKAELFIERIKAIN